MNKLDDVNQMVETLSKMRNDSLYFKYSDKEFYDELMMLISDLEDYICDKRNNAETDIDQQSRNIINVGEKIEKIYAYINKGVNWIIYL